MTKKRIRQNDKRKAKKAAKAKVKSKVCFGLLDTKDNLWLGNKEGVVKLFDDFELACIAARVADVQLGWSPGRTRPMLFTSARRKVDEVPVQMSALKALQLLEEGHVL